LDIYKFGLKIEEVQKASREDDLFRVKTDLGTYLGKTVIVATGRKSRVLDIPGEIEFKNRGVSYCATCDAPFFQDLDVAVIGGGNSALDAVLQLIKIARSIYIIERGPGLKADMILVEKAKVSDNVRILTNARVVEIIGEGRVTGIKVQVEEKEMLLPVRGVFVEIGSIPNSDMVDFVAKNVWGEIIVNCKCETNIPGLFAAGDNTDAPEKQIIIAAGDGCKAAISAFRYVSKNG
jgi:alkyl hydroperoxide reductase subunit F